MEILFFALGLLVAGAANIACFAIGAKIGQQVARGEPVKMPNPVAEIKEARRQQEAQKEDDRQRKWLETVLENVDCYDGSAKGQKKVPV